MESTIRFRRKDGLELWSIANSRFSISPDGEAQKVNIWVESDGNPIASTPSSQEGPVIIELVFPLRKLPDFSNPLHFSFPSRKGLAESWGEDMRYFAGWYHYEHLDLEQINVLIDRITDQSFSISISALVEHPMDEANSGVTTEISFQFNADCADNLEGYWVREDSPNEQVPSVWNWLQQLFNR